MLLGGSGEVGLWGQAGGQARKVLPRPAPRVGLRRLWLLPSVCQPQAAWPQATVRKGFGIRKAREQGPDGEERTSEALEVGYGTK